MGRLGVVCVPCRNTPTRLGQQLLTTLSSLKEAAIPAATGVTANQAVVIAGKLGLGPAALEPLPTT